MRRPRALIGKSSWRSSRISGSTPKRPEQREPLPSRPSPSEVKVGLVGRVHGVHGELHVTADQSILSVITANVRVSLRKQGRQREFNIGAVRHKAATLLVTFDDITDRAAATEWVGAEMWIDSALLLGHATEYFDFELVGLEVFTEAGESIGKITEVLSTGANDVLVVNGSAGEILIPAVNFAVLHIDTANRRVTVDSHAAVYPDGPAT